MSLLRAFSGNIKRKVIPVEKGIEKIINLVSATAHPDKIANLDLSETGITSLLKAASEDLENVRINLVSIIFNSANQTNVESLVQNYQSVLIRLLNDLYNYKLYQSRNGNLSKLYASLSSYLKEILGFIEKYFPNYFNLDDHVPYVYYSIISDEFESRIGRLSLQLREKNVDQQLIEIVVLPFSKFESNQNKNPTYRHLIYLKELLNELNKTIESQASITEILFLLQFQ